MFCLRHLDGIVHDVEEEGRCDGQQPPYSSMSSRFLNVFMKMSAPSDEPSRGEAMRLDNSCRLRTIAAVRPTAWSSGILTALMRQC